MKLSKMFFLTFFLTLGINYVQAQSNSSCFSRTGTISANIQVSFADKVNEPVLFDATNSNGIGDFFKEPIEWDFGDGFKAKMCRATHVYRNAGNYTVTLKVKDNLGNISTATTMVTIANIPSASGNNILTVVTNGSGNGVNTFNTIQSAINKAAMINGSGTVEIILPAGATFIENFELKVPSGNNYITLRSSALNNLPDGIRANRSNLSNFTTVKAPLISDNVPILSTELRGAGVSCTTSETCLPAHHYRLQGIQFVIDPGTLPNGVYEQIIAFGTDSSIQNEESEQAHHLILDRCLIYREDYSASNTNPQLIKNGLEANARNISILDSNFTGINAPGVESHAVTAYNSTGTWGIINNYFEAGSINFFIGGAYSSIPNALINDVEFRRNRCAKPIEKRNLPSQHRWSAKNNFEIKSGKYWVIEENLFDGNWIGSDQRYLVNFNALEDTGLLPTIQDIQFTYNILKQGPSGILLGRVAPANAPFPARFLISNNLMTELGGQIYSTSDCQSEDCAAGGQGFIISNVPTDLIINHNTALIRNNIAQLSGNSNKPILFQNNIVNHGGIVTDGILGYGIKGDGSNPGCPSIDPTLPGCTDVAPPGTPAYLVGSVFNKNIIAGVPYDSRYINNH